MWIWRLLWLKVSVSVKDGWTRKFNRILHHQAQNKRRYTCHFLRQPYTDCLPTCHSGDTNIEHNTGNYNAQSHQLSSSAHYMKYKSEIGFHQSSTPCYHVLGQSAPRSMCYVPRRIIAFPWWLHSFSSLHTLALLHPLNYSILHCQVSI